MPDCSTCENHDHENDVCRGHDYVHDHTECDHNTCDTPQEKVKLPERDPHLANVKPQPWDHIRVIVEGVKGMPLEEQRAYAEHAYHREGSMVDWIKVKVDGDDVDIEYHIKQENFQRIRRITGYLVGTVDRFNDAKQHEEHDRVKHSLGLAHEHTIGQV